MAGKSSVEEVAFNRNRVLNLLINHSGEYGAAELGQTFGLSRRTIQNFVQWYNEMGFEIVSSKGKYYVNSFPPDFTEIKRLHINDDIKKYVVCAAIKKACGISGWTDRNVFIDNFTEECSYFIESESTMQKIIRALQEDGYIDIRDGRLYMHKSPFEDMEDKSIIKLLILLRVMKHVYPKAGILNEVYKKLLWQSKLRRLSFDENIFSYQNKNRISLYDEIILHMLEKAIYENKPVEVSYKNSKAGAITREIVPTGLVYNRWKDLWYLIESGEQDCIYRLDRIIDITILEKECHAAEFNRELYTTSFGISNEPVIEIEVHFEKTPFIYRRLQGYCQERPYAVVTEIEECYILQDKVCGFLEFEKWVRSFGKSAKCIRPQELRDRIKEDVKLMAERYGV